MSRAVSPATAPASWYVDPGYWPKERRQIFAKGWQFATHVSALPAPRAWRAETLAGYPIVLVRDDEGALRAFHNVCRHRAGPLTDGEQGVCDGALVCRYHGWRYALDGRLRNARDFGAAADFDVRDYGLLPVRLEIWRGLAFVALDAEAPPLGELTAPLDEKLGALDWSALRIAARRTHHLKCNWKTYVENYLEGYHIPLLHPGIEAEIKSEEYRVEVEGRVVLHHAPPRHGEAVYDGLWAWMWPNIALNIYKSGLMVERMEPIGHGATRLDYLFLMPEGEASSSEALAMSDAVAGEDKWIVERVQENLDAGVYDTGRLSPKHEAGVAAFQRWVAAALG